MNKQTNFQPIYVWAQSLDNQSNDDFYKLSNGIATLVDDLTISQSIVSQMGDISEYHTNLLSLPIFNSLAPFDTKGINSLMCDVSKKKVWISYASNNKDTINRSSTIDILFDLNGVNKEDYALYAETFFKGFEDFCQQTNRTAHVNKDNEKIQFFINLLEKSFAPKTQLELLTKQGEHLGKLLTQKIPNRDNTNTTSSKLSNNKYHIIVLIVVIIAIIVWFLKD